MRMINNIAILFFASVVIIGCDSKTKLKEDGNENNVVSNFLSDVQSLEIDTNTNSIVAFKELAEEIADNKMVVSKKNIKKVLIKSKDYSNCVVVTGNHTIVKIISFDNCQKSGSWEACMPFVEGYIKKGKLNYKKDYMNNVIGTPDGQQRVAYFFINDKKKPKIKTYSFEKTPNSSFYKNGNIKVKGLGFKKFDRYFVSAKDGLDLMEGAGLNSKKIANIPDSTELWIKSIEGKWLNIYTVFYLNVGDEGYDNEQIDPSQLGGYVNNKFVNNIDIKIQEIEKDKEKIAEKLNELDDTINDFKKNTDDKHEIDVRIDIMNSTLHMKRLKKPHLKLATKDGKQLDKKDEISLALSQDFHKPKVETELTEIMPTVSMINLLEDLVLLLVLYPLAGTPFLFLGNPPECFPSPPPIG